MQTFSDISSIRQQVSAWQSTNEAVALVPTMGHLHEGHVSLFNIAKSHASKVIVSIFVNPLQFNQPDDFEHYPRTLNSDLEILKNLPVDAVFMPHDNEIYPNGTDKAPLIQIPELSDRFCGQFRPGHFDGVCTVVTKLFNIVSPNYAVFGEKDYQQLLIIRRLVEEFNFNINIIAGETLREDSGLAMSSRNSHLSREENEIAPMFYSVLSETKNNFANHNTEQLERTAAQQLEQAGMKVEYFSIRDAENLQFISKSTKKVVILSAIWLGDTRLIDNVLFPLP